jgi:hypothetical protein
MGWMTDPQAWIAFVTLLALEVVLGIDNILYSDNSHSALSGRNPQHCQELWRRFAARLQPLADSCCTASSTTAAKATSRHDHTDHHYTAPYRYTGLFLRTDIHKTRGRTSRRATRCRCGGTGGGCCSCSSPRRRAAGPPGQFCVSRFA